MKLDRCMKKVLKMLHKKCRSKNTLSIKNACLEVGIAYEQIKKWAYYNWRFKHILDECKYLCFVNAQKAFWQHQIPEDVAFKLLCENDEQFNSFYNKHSQTE